MRRNVPEVRAGGDRRSLFPALGRNHGQGGESEIKSFRPVNFPEEARFLLKRTENVCGRRERLLGGCLRRKEDGLIYSRCEAGPGTLARCLCGLCFVTGLRSWWELCFPNLASSHPQPGGGAGDSQQQVHNQMPKTKPPKPSAQLLMMNFSSDGDQKQHLQLGWENPEPHQLEARGRAAFVMATMQQLPTDVAGSHRLLCLRAAGNGAGEQPPSCLPPLQELQGAERAWQQA